MKVITSIFALALIFSANIDSNVANGATSTSGWTSSGGELANDSRNPWWLENTPTVNYCIEVDTETSNASVERVDAAFQTAVAYWKREFTYGIGVRVATQTFVRRSCDVSTIDLKIQVGAGTLDMLQRAFLGEQITNLVGISVRTSYDRANLRGRGFLYLRSDVDRQDRPWSSTNRLNYALIHELGHIFGIPHKERTIMAESAPRRWYLNEPHLSLPARFGHFPDVLEVCTGNDAHYFFKNSDRNLRHPPGWAHYRFKRHNDERNFMRSISVETVTMPDGSPSAPIDAHTAVYEEVGRLEDYSFGLDNLIALVYLPPGQTIVQNPRQLEYLPSNLEIEHFTFYKFVSSEGWTRPIDFYITPRADIQVAYGREDRISSLFYFGMVDGQWPFQGYMIEGCN